MIINRAPLTDLPPRELTELIRQVLNGERFLGPARDVRTDVEPYFDLIDCYEAETLAVKQRLDTAFKLLLSEQLETLTDAGQRHLLRVLQDCGDPLVDDLQRIVRRKTLLETSKDLHALVLKCLVSLNRRQSRAFWLEQFELLGEEYGALILSGLLQHGIEVGFAELPRLTSSDSAARRIALSLPSIVDQFGESSVNEQLELQLPNCRPAARKLLRIGLPETKRTGSIAPGKSPIVIVSKPIMQEVVVKIQPGTRGRESSFAELAAALDLSGIVAAEQVQSPASHLALIALASEKRGDHWIAKAAAESALSFFESQNVQNQLRDQVTALLARVESTQA
jgi:hypothetical protein